MTIMTNHLIKSETVSVPVVFGIYNLSGQRVDASYKGIIIRNGEKRYNK